MSTVLTSQLPLTIDQLPPDLRKTVAVLFTTPTWSVSKCDTMLENILRYAQIEQSVHDQNNCYAKITIHNLLKTYRADRYWRTTCSYQTIHIFVRLLCALGILSKQSGNGQATTYLLPLDPKYCFQVTPTILAAVDQFCDQKQTKNPKMQKKAGEIRNRLWLMDPTRFSKINSNLHSLPLPLQQSIQQLISNLADSLHLSPLVAATLFLKFLEMCAEVLHQEAPLPTSAHVGAAAWPTDTPSVLSDMVSRLREITVDSHFQTPAIESSKSSVLEDSSPNVPATESSDISTLGTSIAALSEQRLLSFEHETQKVAPGKNKNLPNAAPSSIDSLPIKDSRKEELELESKTSTQWTGSEQDLIQEAIGYLKLLDGPEYATADYLNTHAGKKALGGYRNKIRRNPWLARVAAMNTLLHRTFYDLTRQKKPLENAGKWFHSSFDRYADPNCPMEIMGEILDWAKSPYTLEEVALVFSRERRRQETQWSPPEAPHLPFSSCVVTYQHLRNTSSIRQDTEGSLELSSPWMSRVEAEQLADEMSKEGSWYLEKIGVRPEPPLGNQAYIVEASIVGSTVVIAYATRQDWWLDHQEQLRHRRWEAQPQEKKRRTQQVSETPPSGVAV